ncbi:release factor [Leucogyrophana mollusca]|uniref:Release factor n=1 Tax=Leucogyrophana mollusca TaxID=85980 RepID=A0ACB8BBS3_9AGAM|nr:release factor [Leucogyrophana mollusca]
MSSPEDIARARQIKELEPLHEAWTQWTRTRESLQETLPLLADTDPAMRALASEEYTSITSTLTSHIQDIFPHLLVPASTTRQLSAMMELKSGVGGSEASLFLADLLRVYTRYANVNRWKTQVIASNQTDGGGLKDAIVEVKGEGAYDALRWESGVHRVQRVPATEASGRTHTSTVAVIVLPLAEESESMNGDDELFSMDDVKVEVMRARGAGGQHVNKTESAVRLTHVPTGVTVSMQDERSQHQNKRRAFQVLRARLMDIKLTKDIENRRATRRNLVRTADRSEKIRTYNYAQDRVTDHRIGLSLMNLTSFMEGDGVQDFLDALQRNHDEDVMEEMIGDADS